MKLTKSCRTCEFGSDGVCIDGVKFESRENIPQENIGCENWGASLDYYTEITENAPWYIAEPYKRNRISYAKFMDFVEKDAEGIGVEVNIYDAIERIYELKPWELAGVLDVSIGVIGYARMRGTIARRKEQISNRLHIPKNYFDSFLSTQLEQLKECRNEFYDFYGAQLIEKFKQNGIKAMDEKMERDIAKDRILIEQYRKDNQHRYQYKGENKMHHDLSDDYKSRDYVVAITLKDGEYSGNIFYEYTYDGYGLTVSIMKDILDYIESLNCEEIDGWNYEGLLNNNIGLKSDINGVDIHFTLKNQSGNVLKKKIPADQLQKYIIGYEMIRCDGHGMKKEQRRCSSCQKFQPISGSAKGNCSARGDIVQRSRIICAFEYVAVETD
ncbi:MAG: hypothetical protein RSC17_09845 [Lachnospiraceae bacterium]